MAVALILVNPAPAKADHIGNFIYSTCDQGSRLVKYKDHYGYQHQYLFDPCQDGDDHTIRGITHFLVAPNSRVKYQSLVTGNIYLSICGQYDTNMFEYIGNSIKIVSVHYNQGCAS
jgi:hypothetical protein